jgi:PhnB protein
MAQSGRNARSWIDWELGDIMKSSTTYLTFEGNCREAMNFYAKGLGADVHLMTVGESPGNAAPEVADKIMHSRLTKGGLAILMASDAIMQGPPLKAGSNFSVAIECESVDEIDAMFAALSEGGTVSMPLGDMFWGARFGMLIDKFGIQWMFNFEKPKQ